MKSLDSIIYCRGNPISLRKLFWFFKVFNNYLKSNGLKTMLVSNANFGLENLSLLSLGAVIFGVLCRLGFMMVILYLFETVSFAY